ncbi:MAG: HAD family hydrolase [Deltaproteobacteria bacterium]|nr:HAD family hydrolase [Deltaproteobacteria bacterium]
MNSRPVQAILFDLDGTLVDSIRLFRDGMAHVLASYRASLDEDFFWRWHAHRLSWPELLERHGLSPIVEDSFRASVLLELSQRVQRSVAWNGSAREVLAALRVRGLRTGIVTNAPPDHVTLIEEKLGLAELVDVTVTGEEIGRRKKPEPFGLLLAAERIAVPPRNCLYVGDQLFDMQAAERAGMQGVLFRTPQAVDASKVATHVINSFPELFNLLDV